MDYMKRALLLAKKGQGFVNPNPLVGAVIVKNGKIIGEGFHEKYGGPHGEINGFLNAKEDVTGAKLYVNLEPCFHFGKTPPCVETIIKKGIQKVVIGMKDPNPLVSGKSIAYLKQAGIEVVYGIHEKQCRELNEVFIKYITTKKPFVVMKCAMTLDGKIASYTGDSKWVTNEKSRQIVHKMRSVLSAVMVGIGTVLLDNPYLDARIDGGRNPIRIIVDSHLKIPENAHVLDLKNNDRCLVACLKNADLKKKEMLLKKGAEIIELPEKQGQVDLKALFDTLGQKGIDSVLLEGGGELNYSVLSQNLIDKLALFIAPKIIGGRDAKTPVEGEGIGFMKEAVLFEKKRLIEIEGDYMLLAYPKNKK